MAMGDFDQPISFETPVSTPDGLGGHATAWTAIQPRGWARVTAKAQSEAQRQGAVRASRTYLLEMHYRRDIMESMRIRWDGQILNIREIRRGSPRDLTMQIVAEAGVTQ
jgi:SPP1 family predicted phage head-tail adaptor